MTTDRELLEAAAKAAGIEIVPCACGSIQCDNFYQADTMKPFSPLTDDGDALRLAVKVGIEIRFPGAIVSAAEANAQRCVSEKIYTDPYAATRRAIVRAAAEIGKEEVK